VPVLGLGEKKDQPDKWLVFPVGTAGIEPAFNSKESVIYCSPVLFSCQFIEFARVIKDFSNNQFMLIYLSFQALLGIKRNRYI
jgi:hypothetical protein